MRRRARRLIAEPGYGPSDVVTVVIGTDGSPTSWDAFCWGCGEARRLGGRAVAVFGQAEQDQASAEQVERLLESMLRETVTQGLDLTFVHAHGDPATELLRVAEAVQADLIVVGKSTSTRHRLLGSMAQRLIARRPAPVVVIVP